MPLSYTCVGGISQLFHSQPLSEGTACSSFLVFRRFFLSQGFRKRLVESHGCFKFQFTLAIDSNIADPFSLLFCFLQVRRCSLPCRHQKEMSKVFNLSNGDELGTLVLYPFMRCLSHYRNNLFSVTNRRELRCFNNISFHLLQCDTKAHFPLKSQEK